MPASHTIRQQFIDYFVDRCGHRHVPSSPVVPHDDPTLLFTNAGMNQFKDVFLGLGDRPYQRAVNTQKCIRAGGKHNDLDDVGKDTYHHTFFEMLGNWSFGDYFKKEAIEWAWQLLTEVWGLDKNRLHATVFGGDEKEGLDPDHEAAELWRTVTDIGHDRIHFCGKKDNFWEMGESGPCGPCSEIHIDLTDDLSGRQLVNADDARVIEIWNLVFIQFNRDTQGKLTSLPAQHVDTGMGLERIAAVLQGRDSGYDKTNYDTDIFTPLFDAIGSITGATAYNGKTPATLENPVDIAYRVIADHARCLTFALTDGASFGSNKRDSVLRSIARRASRFGRQTLKADEPFLHKLVPTIVEQMGDVFPELKEDPNRIAGLIEEEEIQFAKTLDRGISLFNDAAERATDGQITGVHAFDLESTYGFPFDLTEQMAAERNLSVDVAGYEKAKQKHADDSRGAGGGDQAQQSLIEFLQQQPTEPTRFEGDIEPLLNEVRALHLLQKNGPIFKPTDRLAKDAEAAIVVDRTPFYAESGGQVGDTGRIHSSRGAVFVVTDTQKVGEVVFHLGHLEEDGLETDNPPFDAEDPLMLEIDQPRRQAIMAHHTTTHLMNWALRETLGDHVQQRGSLVDDEKTRFDFANPKPLTDEQIAEVERLVNQRIEENLTVHAEVVDQKKAMKIEGLRAVFGEKYPPRVRVVSIGPPVKKLLKKPEKKEWRQYSVEFCGGTHLPQTADAAAFSIISEENVAKGTRRVIAVAGDKANRAAEHVQTLEGRIDAIGGEDPESLQQDLASCQEALQCIIMPLRDRHRLLDKIAALHAELKEHRKAVGKESEAAVVTQARRIAEEAEGPLIVADLEGADADSLRKAMDVIRSKQPEAAMLIASASADKVAFLAAVPEPLIGRGLKAGDWVREVAKVAGGGGGGRPDMAQAGGKNPARLKDALERARSFAEEALS